MDKKETGTLEEPVFMSTPTHASNLEVDEIPSWDRQHEQILAKWGEISSSYRWMHDRSFADTRKVSLRFTIPIIVFSTLCGTASMSTKSLPQEWQETAPSVIGMVSIVTGILGTVQEFLRVNERVEGHRVASLGSAPSREESRSSSLCRSSIGLALARPLF